MMIEQALKMLAACAAVVAIVFSSHAMTVHRLFSTHPAEDSLAGWERESYPIGNGWFGANPTSHFDTGFANALRMVGHDMKISDYNETGNFNLQVRQLTCPN